MREEPKLFTASDHMEEVGGKEQIGERVGVYGLFGFEAGTSLNDRQRKGGRPKM